jgi:hypothetical protein
MINNYLCEKCGHSEVCKIMDILAKFSKDSKKSLGVNITMDGCSNYDDIDGEDE